MTHDMIKSNANSEMKRQQQQIFILVKIKAQKYSSCVVNSYLSLSLALCYFLSISHWEIVRNKWKRVSGILFPLKKKKKRKKSQLKVTFKSSLWLFLLILNMFSELESKIIDLIKSFSLSLSFVFFFYQFPFIPLEHLLIFKVSE